MTLRTSLLLLILVGLVAYLPSFQAQLFWDDHDFVTKNKYVKEFRLDKFFTAQAVEGAGKVSNYYRPVQFSLYALTYKLFGPSPLAFHTLSILTHIAAAGALYAFLTLLFSYHQKAPGSVSPSHISFLISLLFLIHPIQTEAVSYVAGLSDPLVALFGFLALYFFLKRLYVVSTLLYLCSLGSKESGIIFFGLLFLLSLLSSLTAHRLPSSRLTAHLAPILPFGLLTLLYLIFHFQVIDVVDMKTIWGEHPYTNSVLIRLATFLSLLPTYLSLMVFPGTLHYERDFTTIPLTTLWHLPSVFVLAVLFVVGTILGNEVRKQHASPLSLFFFLAFFISFIPFSGLVLINGLMYEHFVYLPLVFAGAFVLSLIPPPLWQRKTTWGILILSATLLIARSYRRQYDWQDPIRLYTHTLRFAPTSFRVRTNLAMVYQERGMLPEALVEYDKILATNPQVPNPYHNLGNLYLSIQQFDKAEEYFHKAIAIDPNFGYSYVALMTVYKETGNQEKQEALVAEMNRRFLTQ